MNRNCIKFLLIFLFFPFSTNAQEKFSNPIIPGGYPDPSICKVGDTYYIVNSSFEYFPGLPIHKSKDLINWELIGYGLHRKSQVNSTVNLIDVQSNGGIHAPTIRHKDGIYYIITTNVYYDEEKGKADMVNFIITAENPAGPWSDPFHIQGAPGIDPDLFFDDDGRVWYVGNQMPENPNFDGEGEIWLQELDINEFKLIGKKHLLATILARYRMIECLITGRNALGQNGQFGSSVDTVSVIQNNISSPGNIYNLINDIAEILYPYGIQQERIEYFAELVLDGYPSYYWQDTWDDYIENGDDTIVRNKLDVLIGAMINAAENQLM